MVCCIARQFLKLELFIFFDDSSFYINVGDKTVYVYAALTQKRHLRTTAFICGLLSWLGRHTNCGSTNPSRFVIGTFNARGFHSATKREQLSDDLGRLHIDVCCLQETKCPGGFDERCGNYRHIGMPSQSGHYGLASSVSMQFENKNRSLLVGIGQNCRHSIAHIKQLHLYY